jgi:FkbM family methyltransferase
MPQVDFKWLMGQAKNSRTKTLLKCIRQDRNLVYEKGQFAKGANIFSLDLGKYKIWVRKCSAPSSVDIYTEIFKERGHSVLQQFSGKKDKVIIDVGANEGFYTLKMKQNNPEAKIISVEANPLNFEILRKNVKSNKLNKVILVKKALTSKVGKFSFEIVPEVGCISALDIGLQERPWLKKEKIKKVVVDGITLKKLCDVHKIEDIDILKLDVEGAEMDILSSSRIILPRIKKIVVEYHTPKLKQDVKKFLGANQFRLIAEEGSDKRCRDLYFIRR